MKKALICGVSGQDGSLLARHLLDKGYNVFGSSRDAQMTSFYNLDRLGIREDVHLESIAPNDFRSVLQALSRIEPDEVYNLAGQTSVGLSFDQPVETLESITTATLNFMEALRFSGLPARYYNAGSSECFGSIPAGSKATENTPFYPRSPYAVAKAGAHWLVTNYRESYGIDARNGVLFNHESALRPERFVTRRVIDAAIRIADGSDERLSLGNLNVHRDWGYAPEYVDGMWRILQIDTATDYILATGESHSLEEFVEAVFKHLGLNWRDHVDVDATRFRPSDIDYSCGDSTRAATELDWRATVTFDSLVARLVDTVREPNLLT